MEIFKLFGSVLVEEKAATESLCKIDEKAEGVGGKLATMGGAALKAGAVIGAAAASGAVALFGLAEKASETASEFNDLSAKTGLNTDRLQELKFAADQTGTPFEALETAAAKLTKTMDAAKDANSSAGEAFAQLGISVKDSQGNLKSMDDVMPQVLAKLADMPNATERNALAMQLLGKGAMDMAPLLGLGSAGIEEMTKKAHELGLVMSTEAIEAGDAFGDTWDATKATLEGVVTKIGIEFLPMFQKVLDWVMAHMPEIQKTMDTVFGVISTVVTTVYNIFTDDVLPVLQKLYDWVQPYIPQIKDFIINAFQDIWNIVEKVWRILDKSLFPILKKIYDWVVPYFPVIGNVIKAAFDVVIGVVNKVLDVFSSVIDKINAVVTAVKDFFGATDNKSISVGVSSTQWELPAMATGGTVISPGRVLVGEEGPEILDLPSGARVTPLGTGNQNNIFNIYGNNAEEIWDGLYNKLLYLGVV